MKNKEKNQHKEKDIMYFKINAPLILRKEILKTAIDTTQILREYESFKAIKHLKLEKYKEFNRVFSEIENLTKKLRAKDLPVISRIQKNINKDTYLEKKTVRQKEEMEKLKSKPKVEEPKKEVKVEHHLTEEEKLEHEIMDIQARLNKLNV